MDSPISVSYHPYVGIGHLLDVPLKTAQLLDKLRTVTISVIDFLSSSYSKATAIYQECDSVQHIIENSTNERPGNGRLNLIHKAISITASIYIRCIAEGVPFSEIEAQEMQELTRVLVTLDRGALDHIPGILLWIQLVGQSATQKSSSMRVKFRKSLLLLGQSLGFVSSKETIASLDTFLQVQRFTREHQTAKSMNDRFLRTETP